MSSEQAVRDALDARAARTSSVPLSGAALRAQAQNRRRSRWRGTAVAIAAAAGVVAVLIAVPSVVRRDSAPPASSQVDTWPARGDLAGDTALAAAARRAWEAAPVYQAELPHRDVRVLLASTTNFGRYVMVTGVNALGHRRLAVFSDDPRDHVPYRSRLRLRSDDAFPEGPLVSYVTSRGTGEARKTLLLVAAPLDVTTIRWRASGATDDPWSDLPSRGGAAAWVEDGESLEYDIRGYRENGKKITGRASGLSHRFVYRPDEAVLQEGSEQQVECDGGTCTAGLSGTMSAQAQAPGTLTTPQNRPDERWEDMSDQAEQLWLNYGAQHRSISQWGGGTNVSTLLPDNTGIYLATHSVNGGGDHTVLYVDRPEWPIGRLYLAAPNPDQRLRAVTAVVPAARARQQLVVVAAEGVTIRYHVGDGSWQVMDVSDVIAAATLPKTVDPTEVRIEYTYQGHAQVLPPDTVAALPLP